MFRALGLLAGLLLSLSIAQAQQVAISFQCTTGVNPMCVVSSGNPLPVTLAGGVGATVNQGNKGTNAQAWWVEIGDATTGPAVVQPASTTPAATDKSLTVSLSPNSSGLLTTGTAGTPATAVLTVQGISGMTPLLTTPSPTTSGGLSWTTFEPAASDNHTVLKNGAGQVYHISATNNSATINYLRLYNAGTGFNGCNSATNLVFVLAIPASTNGAGVVVSEISMGLPFATGISYCVSSAYGQNTTTNATASAMDINIGYK